MTTTTTELLKELSMRANNIIMKGNFSGDDIHEASEVMNLCIKIHQAICDQRKALGKAMMEASKENEQKAD